MTNAFLPFFPLWSDLLLWLLGGAAALYGWYCSRRPHLALPWRRVFRSRAAVVACVVLGFFLLAGLLVSVHYRQRLQQAGTSGAVNYSPEVLSLLDWALSDLKERRERTYSAPLATRLYTKEQMEAGPGKAQRDFPRLRYGGAHLADEAGWAKDVLGRVALGLLCAAAAAVAILLVARRLGRWRPEVPW